MVRSVISIQTSPCCRTKSGIYTIFHRGYIEASGIRNELPSFQEHYPSVSNQNVGDNERERGGDVSMRESDWANELNEISRTMEKCRDE